MTEACDHDFSYQDSSLVTKKAIIIVQFSQEVVYCDCTVLFSTCTRCIP